MTILLQYTRQQSNYLSENTQENSIWILKLLGRQTMVLVSTIEGYGEGRRRIGKVREKERREREREGETHSWSS